ncbi:hypothetical protein EVAR_65394_1 [Eumeta japonica]|uniref:Uncharacterized protein n=1 Tax=Eumeta variegata TaxID=151549 RepID=A0A4C1ZG38_EUMVA|nr:hypothetical protein EVAR_65394_1 [Eumeta japonica]
MNTRLSNHDALELLKTNGEKLRVGLGRNQVWDPNGNSITTRIERGTDIVIDNVKWQLSLMYFVQYGPFLPPSDVLYLLLKGWQCTRDSFGIANVRERRRPLTPWWFA